MKFTLGWLGEHFDTNASLSKITESLPTLGFPVESVEDWVPLLQDFCVVEVQDARPHPHADRLKVCTVWTGNEQLQIVCGASNVRSGMRSILARPGQRVPGTGQVLKESMIREVASQGMLCAYGELALTAFSDGEGGIISLGDQAVIGSSVVRTLGLDDPVVDIEVTPNRGDMLSVRGIARELAASGLGQFIGSIVPMDDGATFLLHRLEGVQNALSPGWLVDRLRAVGCRSISTLVDLTNYVMLDLGKPLHVFDADKVQGIVRLERAQGGELFEGLDEKIYTLPEGALVLLDDGGIISLAGILGGLRTGCTFKTQNVLVESAWFAPEDIARTGQALGVHTDARARFERGVDPALVRPGLSRVVQLIQSLCGGKDCGLAQEMVTARQTPQSLELNLERLETLGGLRVAASRAQEILKGLGFQPILQKKNISVTVPSWRFDMKGEADLVEEILRVVGYDNIPACPLPFRPLKTARTLAQKRPHQAREQLVARGFCEVVTWSFLSQKKAILFGGGREDLTLTNPLSQEWAVMRPSILPQLLDLALYHQNHSLAFKGFFEVGPQYRGVKDQQTMTAGIVSTDRPVSWRPSTTYDVFTVKEHALAVLESLGVTEKRLRVCPEGPSWYHPKRVGSLCLGPHQTLGFFGEIHPCVLEAFGLNRRVLGFEIFLDALPAPKALLPRPFLPLSPFPATILDLAFLVDREFLAGDLLKVMRQAAGGDLQNVEVFDVFQDDIKTGPSKKSLALRLTFQSLKHTLPESFIQGRIEAIAQAVRQKCGAILRDGAGV